MQADGKRKLHVHVYLVLSIRGAMETLENSSRRKTKLHVHGYLVLSVRRVIHTPEFVISAKSENGIIGVVIHNFSYSPIISIA